MGIRYVRYRVSHEIEKKIGLLKVRHPKVIRPKVYVDKADFKRLDNFLVTSKENISIEKNQCVLLKNEAQRILNNEYYFFGSIWFNLGKDYNWITNPTTGYTYDINKHWSEIVDLSEEAGDIKYVWEKSRFSYLHTLIRYDYHYNVDLSEFVFNEIESWITANPINCGPNWKCSQEISLRILNWYYALQYYKNSNALSEARWRKIQEVIYASLHHVYHHINFSRIAVRNNHAITETMFLTLSNLMFPFFEETKKWADDGRKWFEQEIKYQIYEDGTFLQFSMNYHRVVIQLLNFAISLYHKNGLIFNEVVYDRAYKSVDFLYQCMQDENGKLPNYGSNDGALFFPFTSSDFRDYRSQLNALHFTLTGMDLDESFDREESYWFGRIQVENIKKRLQKNKGVMSFDLGGYYLCRHNSLFVFIRCGNHKDRPAQADNLHIDIWYNGENVLRDGGSYKYNTTKEMLDYFMGTKSHNTVSINDNSQMLKGGRFIWYYWSQCLGAKWEEIDDYFEFTGTIKAFSFLNSNITHFRKIRIYKDAINIIVNDLVSNSEKYVKRQIWHPNSELLKIKSNIEIKSKFKSYMSDYYGKYIEDESFYYEFKDSIETTLEIKN
ncbi:alginate lyase family protein [Myroides odoratimimus]|nr:alginate lyase family protein [Myroides odoratimimus]